MNSNFRSLVKLWSNPTFHRAASGGRFIENLHCGKLVVEVLDTEPYRGFSGFYEEALASGSALVFYSGAARSAGAAA